MDRKPRLVMRLSVVAAALASAAIGVTALGSFPEPPMCPAVYAPVLCANGFYYNNGCEAFLAGQTNCVRADPPGETS